jgi:molybdopterin synthase catalytic subunit
MKVRRIVEEEIDPTAVVESVQRSDSGAVVLFLGTVRGEGPRQVKSIFYECYVPMAEKKLEEIESDLKRKWPVGEVRIVHRIGIVRAGQVSVAVAVSTTHRAQAFEACRHAMDRIKHEVPIWKKERSSDGADTWVEGEPMRSGTGEGLDTQSYA